MFENKYDFLLFPIVPLGKCFSKCLTHSAEFSPNLKGFLWFAEGSLTDPRVPTPHQLPFGKFRTTENRVGKTLVQNTLSV